MNGGQIATRGFLLQTLVALLDILTDIEKVESLTLEPSTGDDKTDFVIRYVGGKTKAAQVKSSQNQIGLPAAKKWARKLKADFTADEYELCLIGPCSGDLSKASVVEGVKLPVPKSLDIAGMLEQACHRLDTYLNKNGIDSGSPAFRERMVEGLIGKLSAYSTAGIPITGTQVKEIFGDWRVAAEELAINDLKAKYGNGTLTDVDALKEYSAHFDRAALQDTLHGCWSYKRFAETLGELIELLNTGTVRGKFIAKRRSNFARQEWKDGLADVYHSVRELRECYTKLVRSGQIDEESCGCNCPADVVADFENRKRSIIVLLNRVLNDASLPSLKPLN